jgi:nucleotide-binding universal stress UspA family protein
MKKILVLTDFSDNASHAASSAIFLASKVHASVLLFHTFIRQTVPVNAETPWQIEELMWADQSKYNLAYLTENLEPLVDQLPPADYHPKIHTESAEGSLAFQLKEQLKNHDIEFIVMGDGSGTTMENILAGSSTTAVIEHTTRPVIIIPAAAQLQRLKKVIFATDFDEADIQALGYLTGLGKLFDFQLEIAHVKLFKQTEQEVSGPERSFFEKVEKLHYPNLLYQEVKGKDLVNRLNRICKDKTSDLLVMVHDQRGLLGRLFGGSVSKAILKRQSLPVMIIPGTIKV